MIVLDASATLDGYFRPECWQPLVSHIRTKTVLVPQHFLIECLNGLRRIDRLHNISDSEFAAFQFFVEQMPFVIVPTAKLTKSIWSMRHNMTAYDAHYVAIASVFSAPLATHDERLAKAASGMINIVRLDELAP
jgi:predicted nucleic acid-binding protein